MRNNAAGASLGVLVGFPIGGDQGERQLEMAAKQTRERLSSPVAVGDPQGGLREPEDPRGILYIDEQHLTRECISRELAPTCRSCRLSHSARWKTFHMAIAKSSASRS